MNHLTVSQRLYGMLKKNGRTNKSAMLLWKVPYEHNGMIKTANADTIGRKARELAEEGWLKREEVNGQTWYEARTKEELETDDAFDRVVHVPLLTPTNRTAQLVPEHRVDEFISKGYTKL